MKKINLITVFLAIVVSAIGQVQPGKVRTIGSVFMPLSPTSPKTIGQKK